MLRNLRQRLSNQRGVIDLASIMVGVLVIGAVSSTISASVFGVIPWAQDHATAETLRSVASAEAGHRAKHAVYADTPTLVEDGWIAAGDYLITLNPSQDCFVAAAPSPSGATLYRTSESPDIMSDRNGPVDTGSCAPTPKFTPELSGTLTDGDLGLEYVGSVRAIGTPAPTVAVTSGALPAGVSVSEAGALRGVPTEVGTFTFELTATNQNGAASRDYTMQVRPPTELTTTAGEMIRISRYVIPTIVVQLPAPGTATPSEQAQLNYWAPFLDQVGYDQGLDTTLTATVPVRFPDTPDTGVRNLDLTLTPSGLLTVRGQIALNAQTTNWWNSGAITFTFNDGPTNTIRLNHTVTTCGTHPNPAPGYESWCLYQ